MGIELKTLGENATKEFFETLVYFTAYEEARKIIENLTKDIEDPTLREAVESALNVLAFGLVFELIRMEEAFIERIFAVAETLVLALVGYGKRIKRALLRGRGIKALLRSFLGGFFDNSSQLAQLVILQVGNQLQARQSIYSGQQGLFGAYIDTKRYIVERENHHLDIANSFVKRDLELFPFKLFTANFTEKDKVLLKKILGKSNISVEDLNKISEFLFVKDDRGNIVGLSKAFLELLNGLGWLHNR
jgi:hypothetical protein